MEQRNQDSRIDRDALEGQRRPYGSVARETSHSRSPAKPDEPDRKTDDKKTSDKGTGTQPAATQVRVALKEPPLPRSQKLPVAERWEFYQRNRENYPPHIQAMLGRIDKPSDKNMRNIDLAIRAHYGRELFKAHGIPFEEPRRIPTSGPGGSGGDWEQTNQSLSTGERPRLSVSSRTKSGETVQIDDFDTDRRVPREYKATLDIPKKDPEVAKREIEARMMKHAEFAEDYGLPSYEWVANSNRSKRIMIEALADLKGKAMSVTDLTLRQKLLNRYRKIQIVEEVVFDKE